MYKPSLRGCLRNSHYDDKGKTMKTQYPLCFASSKNFLCSCFCLLFLASSVMSYAQATNPQVPQGGTKTFNVVNDAPFGSQISQNSFYQVLDPNGNQVASSFDFYPTWTVSTDGVTVTITAPADAIPGVNYIVDIQTGNYDKGKDTATYFNVVASGTKTGNIVVTGHDDDYHAVIGGDTNAAKHATGIINTARQNSPIPSMKVLIFDHGTELASLLTQLGVAYDKVDPDAGMPSASLFDASKYSAIGVASDVTAGGTDNTTTSSSNLIAAKSSFSAFHKAGGGIFAFAAADNAHYYDFLPVVAVAIDINNESVTSGFSQTAFGASVGIPALNGDITHDVFASPGTSGEDSGWQAAEVYQNTNPETLVYLGQ